MDTNGHSGSKLNLSIWWSQWSGRNEHRQTWRQQRMIEFLRHHKSLNSLWSLFKLSHGVIENMHRGFWCGAATFCLLSNETLWLREVHSYNRLGSGSSSRGHRAARRSHRWFTIFLTSSFSLWLYAHWQKGDFMCHRERYFIIQMVIKHFMKILNERNKYMLPDDSWKRTEAWRGQCLQFIRGIRWPTYKNVPHQQQQNTKIYVMP